MSVIPEFGYYCIYYEFSGFSISIIRHSMRSRDALVLGVSGRVQRHGRRPKKTPRKKTAYEIE